MNNFDINDSLLLELFSDAHELRRHIHHYPELSNLEYETTNYLESFFKAHNIQFNRFLDVCGGYVFIDANQEETIAFRADIDALPLTENTNLPHSSKNIGVMHACGHDMHTAIASALSLVLSHFTDKLKKNVLIIFQPAEEANPIGGAKSVINSGIFQRYAVSSIFGLHVWPSLPIGTIGTKSGILMAASDRFTIDVMGKCAHGAQPHLGVDAITISCDIINNLVHKLRREISPFEDCVLTVGEIKSEGRYNVICDSVKIEGTVRTLSNTSREYYHKRINELSKLTATMSGGSVNVKINKGYDPVDNNPQLTEHFVNFAQKYLGEENVISSITSSMIGEDFSFYNMILPSVYFFLGCETPHALHSNEFYAPDEILPISVKLIANYFLFGDY